MKKIVILKINETPNIAQTLSFPHAPVKAVGAVLNGKQIDLLFIVDTGNPATTCKAWINNAQTPNVEGSPIGFVGDFVITSDCFA
jgi:hypothetical protein